VKCTLRNGSQHSHDHDHIQNLSSKLEKKYAREEKKSPTIVKYNQTDLLILCLVLVGLVGGDELETLVKL